MSPIPVVVIGKMGEVATAVRKGLTPEYDVTHIMLTVEHALKDLPLLLSNPSQTPADTAENLGSKNYGSRPRIVAIGGGHSEEDFRDIKAGCKDVEKGIIWIKKDISKLTQKPDFSNLEAYGALTAQQMKEKLNAMELDKPGNEDVEGVHYFS
ncbi:hypothetical protein CC86DRAFT_371965 [Ophiobolus disseminans]|uniref:Uncharacterized protein n=1 Tax=Ophiobolus disseminans TaxID=1469910 RepID=A0A6A6ZT06_9PLEO|nr:hypothetical protein CC86DRAFT_371965 [Ophiobolus disseminans]